MGQLLFSFCSWHLEHPLQHPTAISQHSCTSLSLISLFHGNDVMMESFPMFDIDDTKSLWEQIQTGVQEMNFDRHITPYILVRVEVH